MFCLDRGIGEINTDAFLVEMKRDSIVLLREVQQGDVQVASRNGVDGFVVIAVRLKGQIALQTVNDAAISGYRNRSNSLSCSKRVQSAEPAIAQRQINRSARSNCDFADIGISLVDPRAVSGFGQKHRKHGAHKPGTKYCD